LNQKAFFFEAIQQFGISRFSESVGDHFFGGNEHDYDFIVFLEISEPFHFDI
jgi:hypothetical protein